MRNLDNIVETINHLRDDVKAEAIIADIIESGIEAENIIIFPDGLFKRRFNKDILGAGVRRLENDQNVLEVHTTRDGIYDTLPAGLFHDHPTESMSRGKEMAGESKRQRLIEKEARRFFLPFENEIFLKLVDLEMEERKILNSYSENLFDDIFSGFWKLDGTLPHKFLSRLIILLPLAHRISGDPEMIAKTLEIIIEEKCMVRWATTGKSCEEHLLPAEDSGKLGSATLGIDFVCDQISSSNQPVLEFVIGPLENSSVEDYLENGDVARFLDCFYGYFVPVEKDLITRVLVDEKVHGFTLDPAFDALLGYNTAI